MSSLPTLSSSSLSTPSTNAILAPLPSTPLKQTPSSDIDSVYDIPNTIAHLSRVYPPAKAVSLQFPDHLLPDSVQVFRRIQKALDGLGHGGKAFVLADTTYGSCCIDSLSAMHVSSDFLVHYGHACLTRSSDPSLRIRYVFPRLPISIPSVVDAILSLESEDVPRDKSVLVMYDVGYYWALEGMEEEVGRRRSSEEKGKGREVIFSRIELDEQEGKSSEGSSEEAGREVARESAYCSADPSSTSSGCCGGAATTSSSNAESKPPSSCCSSSSPNQPSIASTSCCQSQSTAPSSPLPLPQSNPSPSDPLSSTLSSKTASLRSYSLLPATSISDYAIFYIGEPDSLQIRNILVTHSRNAIYSYSPTTHPEGAQPDTAVSEEAQEMPTPVLQSIRTNRLLMRRYAIMQKARDADVFGLLVGNVNLANSLPLLTRLRELLRKAHKKTYTISVGKLNPAKLANFAEIECFVLVACGENSLVDSKDFLRPIITPFELELALQDAPEWTGDYVLDFTRLLSIAGGPDEISEEDVSTPAEPSSADVDPTAKPEGDAGVDGDEFDQEDPLNQPVFSTITGQYRHPKRFGTASDLVAATSKSLSLRSPDSSQQLVHTHLTNPSELFKARSWVGLDPRIGLDRVSKLEEGRGGRAWTYGEEGERREMGGDKEGEND